ncbi:MAG: hypothetical protein Q7T76_10295 [Ferruginibacter sp.]|nr:hypothetical protein [Ferruginibacter sp.]
MKFGNWNITEQQIEWTGNGLQTFAADRSTLLETMPSEATGEKLYKWIVQATEEEWMSHDDLYDLNFAFVYAASQSGGDFSYEVLDRTVEYQYDVLEEEEDDEEDDD